MSDVEIRRVEPVMGTVVSFVARATPAEGLGGRGRWAGPWLGSTRSTTGSPPIREQRVAAVVPGRARPRPGPPRPAPRGAGGPPALERSTAGAFSIHADPAGHPTPPPTSRDGRCSGPATSWSPEGRRPPAPTAAATWPWPVATGRGASASPTRTAPTGWPRWSSWLTAAVATSGTRATKHAGDDRDVGQWRIEVGRHHQRRHDQRSPAQPRLAAR